MARPVWHQAGDDPEAIADLLERAADAAPPGGALEFTPQAAAAGRDGRALHQAALLVARRRLTERHGEKDRIIAESVRALDDLARATNLLGERLAEWYALHAPEAVRAAGADELAALVARHGAREGVMEALSLTGISVGAGLAPEDIQVVKQYAAGLAGLYESRQAIEARLGPLMEEVAPNLAAVTGPVVGSRLIAQAGGLQRLATMSSGTAQTLGAETALFRHLKEGTDPPKHGILFQHPRIFQAPPWQRGAIARAFAVHLVVAARADAFTGNDLRDPLRAGLEEDLSRIGRSKAKPPARGGRGAATRRGSPAKRGPPAKRGARRHGPTGTKASPGKKGRGKGTPHGQSGRGKGGPSGPPGRGKGGPPGKKRGERGAPPGPAKAPGRGGRS